jgi:electron transport complex protein RnfD
MLHVIIALIPAFAASVIIFGIRAAVVTVTCVASCVFFEYFFRKITKKEQTVSDLSAAVTGILLAFNLPVTLPLYMVIIGAFVAIVVVKQMFGGIGQNFANPAIVARIVLMMSFTPQMSSWVKPFYYKMSVPDAVTTASPLGAEVPPGYADLFLGINAGSLGETCALALLIGFVYLLAARVIRPVTPVAFVGVFAAATFFAGGDVLTGILSGGLLLGAIFMATDYATTPLTPLGKIIFGAGCGVITFAIRQFGTMPEGVAFSILIMNILTPYIDKLTRPTPFGAGTGKQSGKEMP